VIVVGGLFGLMASIMGTIFPLPRLVYAMAQDGLVFRFLGSVNPWTNTPFVATWVCGSLVALMAVILTVDALVQMMSIGTLMAYTLVAVSVLVQHYQREQVRTSETLPQITTSSFSSSQLATYLCFVGVCLCCYQGNGKTVIPVVMKLSE